MTLQHQYDLHGARGAASFDNPDFVEVVLHSYRHRFGLVPAAGHNLPQEAPGALAQAVLNLL